MNCRELATEFEQVKMIDSIRRISDIEELKKITIRLIELNFGLKEQFAAMLAKGWNASERSSN